MKKRYPLLLLLLLSLLSRPALAAGDTTRVLFIGNSFTFYHNMPEILRGMAAKSGLVLDLFMHAPGGATVGDVSQGAFAHMENPAVFTAIRGGKWDFVVLQDNQGRFIYDEGVFHPSARTLEGHKKIRDSVLFYHPCARMVWFAGWAFKNGSPPYGNTGVETIDRIYKNYKFLNDSLKQILSPIGVAWKRSLQQLPAVDLWDADEAHPSLAGSYLTAATLYATLFRQSAQRHHYPAGLDSATAVKLRQIGYQAAFDSAVASRLSVYTLPLTSSGGMLSTAAASGPYRWFRNNTLAGNTTAPSFASAGPGYYQVKGRSSSGCPVVSWEQYVSASTSVAEVRHEGLKLYPNPARQKVQVELPAGMGNGQWSLADPSGRRLRTGTFAAGAGHFELSLEYLPAGSYLLAVSAAGWQAATQLTVLP